MSRAAEEILKRDPKVFPRLNMELFGDPIPRFEL